MTMNELFQPKALQTTTAGATRLPVTVELMDHATIIVNTIVNFIMDGETDYSLQIESAKHDSAALDSLVKLAYDFTDIDVEYLKAYDADTIDKALKSQQSKRSRIKAISPLTYENFIQLMTAAVCELLIRKAIGKANKNTGYVITEDLANNQAELAKRIRNVQSKKSMAKGRRDFDEASEKWLALLEEEAALKALRPAGAARATTSNSQAVNDAKALLETINDPNSLKASEAKDLLAQIASLLK